MKSKFGAAFDQSAPQSGRPFLDALDLVSRLRNWPHGASYGKLRVILQVPSRPPCSDLAGSMGLQDSHCLKNNP